MNLPQCSQCLRPQEPQELKEAYQWPVISDNHSLAYDNLTIPNALSQSIVSYVVSKSYN